MEGYWATFVEELSDAATALIPYAVAAVSAGLVISLAVWGFFKLKAIFFASA